MRVGQPLIGPIEDLRYHIDRCFASSGVENGYPWTGFDYEFAVSYRTAQCFTFRSIGVAVYRTTSVDQHS